MNDETNADGPLTELCSVIKWFHSRMKPLQSPIIGYLFYAYRNKSDVICSHMKSFDCVTLCGKKSDLAMRNKWKTTKSDKQIMLAIHIKSRYFYFIDFISILQLIWIKILLLSRYESSYCIYSLFVSRGAFLNQVVSVWWILIFVFGTSFEMSLKWVMVINNGRMRTYSDLQHSERHSRCHFSCSHYSFST